MVFVLSLFVPNLSFVLCFGKVVRRDGDVFWVSSLMV